jgi:hypothetical protein
LNESAYYFRESKTIGFTYLFPWQEKLIAPLDATLLKNVAKGTRIGKAKDETTIRYRVKLTKRQADRGFAAQVAGQ